MREFRITEAQLDELASLNNETAEEARRSDEIVAAVKAQPLNIHQELAKHGIV